MKAIIIIATTLGLFVACDSRVSTAPAEKVTERETTVINPPAKEEKKVETNTTIINPPASAPAEEKKSSPK
jgi:hypothetical protein